MPEKKNNKRTSKRRKRKGMWKSIFKGLLISIVVLIFGCAAAAGYIYYKYSSQIKQSIADGYKIASNITAASFDTREPTRVYDTNDKLIKAFSANNYYYTKASDLNPYVFQAFVAVEDRRFYQDGAIDYKGTLRALLVDLKSGGHAMQGGSTITQELARNVFLNFDKNIWRKLEEAVIANQIEKEFTKEQILEFYVNNINYANGCYSIESASEYYFQKSTEELDLSQIALLAGIPNNPSYYNPLYHLDNALQRRNLILKKMLDSDYISQSQYNEAVNEKITLDIKNSKDQPMNYALQYAVYNATKDLMVEDGFVFRYSFADNNDRQNYFNQYNADYLEKEKELLSGGYNIYTSIDTAKQTRLQEIVDSELSGYTARDPKTGLYEKQGASVTIDNSTGEVVAIVGGRSQEGNTFNRAFLAVRQPGSTIKPLIVYTPAFERGYIPSSTFSDSPITNGPVNDDHKYRGTVTLEYALDISINTIPFRLLEQDGVQTSLQYLKNMQFKYIMPQDTSPIVAIGGFTEGVTPVEMASGYSTLARNGEFISPTNVRKLTNGLSGDVLYENQHEQTKIYDSGASYLMTDALKTVISSPSGTAHNLMLNDYPYVAGKTGTTNGSKDAWFIGYTPYYTTAVWVGDDKPAPQNMFGDTVPGHIWQKYMEYLHQDLVQKDFVKPDTIVEENGVLMDSLYLENQQQNSSAGQNSSSSTTSNNDSEESIYEQSANDAITALENFNLTDASQIAQADQLVQSANDALANVKNQDVYDSFKTRIENKVNQLNEIESSLENSSQTQQQTGNGTGNNTSGNTNSSGQQSNTGGSGAQQNQTTGSGSQSGSGSGTTSASSGGSTTGTQQGQSVSNH